jgi:hypothetical protein
VTFSDFQAIYDFTVIETAVQSLFVSIAGYSAPSNDDDPNAAQWTPPAGSTPFYTAFQALTFQKCRPRVYIASFEFQPVRQAYAIDGNGNLREKAWTGNVRLGIITAPNYSLHTQLRAQVLAIVPQIQPAIAVDNSAFGSTGINAILQTHQVSEFYADSQNTTIIPEEGTYRSTVNIKLAFSVLPSAWPAGMKTY